MKIYARPDVFAKKRLTKGLSQRELARRSQLSHGYISMLERTFKTVGPSAAKRLSDVLETPVEELFRIE